MVFFVLFVCVIWQFGSRKDPERLKDIERDSELALVSGKARDGLRVGSSRLSGSLESFLLAIEQQRPCKVTYFIHSARSV